MSEVMQQDRAREVLAATPHSANCPWNMSEWDKAAFTSNELMEMQCDCDQVTRAMLAFAAEAVRAERERCVKLVEDRQYDLVWVDGLDTYSAIEIATAIRALGESHD